jgi:hypothetical protein
MVRVSGLTRGVPLRITRFVAVIVAVSVLGPVIGCSSPNNNVNAGNPPPIQQPRPQNNNPIANMSTGQKVAVLAGAAAIYYLYKKHQNAKGNGAQGQYYRSKNGGVYYRDAQGRPVWVQAPSGGIQVPANEAPQYEQGARQYGFTNGIPPGPAGPG